jgi:hypothetical protein
MPNQAFAVTEAAGHMTELVIALLVVTLAFGLFWWTITLIPLRRRSASWRNIALSIALVVVLLGYVLPMIYMPRVDDRTIRSASSFDR